MSILDRKTKKNNNYKLRCKLSKKKCGLISAENCGKGWVAAKWFVNNRNWFCFWLGWLDQSVNPGFGSWFLGCVGEGGGEVYKL